MDRICQWDRHATRYSWVFCAVSVPLILPIYLLLTLTVQVFGLDPGDSRGE